VKSWLFEYRNWIMFGDEPTTLSDLNFEVVVAKRLKAALASFKEKHSKAEICRVEYYDVLVQE
jgi:hypothetical protein